MDGRRYGTNPGRTRKTGSVRSRSGKSNPCTRSPVGSSKRWPWLSDRTKRQDSTDGRSLNSERSARNTGMSSRQSSGDA
eukprot:9849803-Heterocapsa_arctica.AAC.1